METVMLRSYGSPPPPPSPLATPEHQQCPICYEEYNSGMMISLSVCGHRFCKSCLRQHLVTLAAATSLPKCPHQDCSCLLQADEMRDILGHDYNPKPSASPLLGSCTTSTSTSSTTTCRTTAKEQGECDVQFRAWLASTDGRECGGCGNFVLKSDGCNKMQCLCGYRFCYQCGNVGATCSCDGRFHGFYDNTLLRADFSQTRPVKKVDESMKEFLNRQQVMTKPQVSAFANRRKRLENYAQRREKSNDRKAKIIQRLIQSDIDVAVELYHMELEESGGAAPIWAGELTPYVIFLGKSQIQAVFPGVPCPDMYFFTKENY